MQQIVLFDGVCNLCNASVQFILRRDRRRRFQFAPLQSRTAHQWVGADAPQSIVYVRDGAVLTASTAVLYIARDLGGVCALAFILIGIPRALRDWAYLQVAKRRYAWFGQRSACMVPTPELMDRFLD